MSQFKNLVFKGGGVKGVAYIGAISVLEDTGILEGIRRVCGTSSGAIMAAHVALGGRAIQLAENMSNRFLSGLLDRSAWFVRDFTRLIQDYGWFHGHRLSMWIKRHIEGLCGNSELTFGELAKLCLERPDQFKELSVVATNVTLQCPQVFDATSTPDARIWEALRASMSIPFLFSAARLSGGEIYVDGGLTWNYPINFYDDCRLLSRDSNELYALLDHHSSKNSKTFYNKETLGLMSETRAASRPPKTSMLKTNGKIESFPNYLKAMLGLMTDVTTSNFLNLPDWQRTIFIEAFGVRSTDFNISDEGIKRLIDSGKKSALAYIEWFENPRHEPLNRVVEVSSAKPDTTRLPMSG